MPTHNIKHRCSEEITILHTQVICCHKTAQITNLGNIRPTAQKQQRSSHNPRRWWASPIFQTFDTHQKGAGSGVQWCPENTGHQALAFPTFLIVAICLSATLLRLVAKSTQSLNSWARNSRRLMWPSLSAWRIHTPMVTIVGVSGGGGKKNTN